MPTLFDLDLDPVTRDFVDTADGLWQERDDSRTAVHWQLEERADEWWGDDRTGSLIGQLLEREEPATPEELRDECLRSLQLLVDEGIIADLAVVVGDASIGRATIDLSWTDVGSGRRVDLGLNRLVAIAPPTSVAAGTASGTSTADAGGETPIFT